jgi:hypothetical protein
MTAQYYPLKLVVKTIKVAVVITLRRMEWAGNTQNVSQQTERGVTTWEA